MLVNLSFPIKTIEHSKQLFNCNTLLVTEQILRDPDKLRLGNCLIQRLESVFDLIIR